jgi:hypothetical protein
MVFSLVMAGQTGARRNTGWSLVTITYGGLEFVSPSARARPGLAQRDVGRSTSGVRPPANPSLPMYEASTSAQTARQATEGRAASHCPGLEAAVRLTAGCSASAFLQGGARSFGTSTATKCPTTFKSGTTQTTSWEEHQKALTYTWGAAHTAGRSPAACVRGYLAGSGVYKPFERPP